MEEERVAYYRLAELFGTVVPAALSDLLKKAMTEKPVDGYQHMSSWWKAHKESLSRAPPTGIEIVTVNSKDPTQWPTNLLLKVIKYSNHELLVRYEVVWNALNVLVDVRKKVLDHQEAKRIPVDRMQEYFTKVFDTGISKFSLSDTEDTFYALEDLKTKSPSSEEGEKYHKELLRQEKGWAEFEDRLYERGAKPKIPQLRNFLGKAKTLNVIQEVAPHYTTIGTYLLKDDNGAIVDGIHMGKMGNVVRTTEEIFYQWLQGGAGPTWNVLVKCLRHAGLNPLAKQIDECLL